MPRLPPRPFVPPRFAVRALLSARRTLLRALDAITPAEFTVLEHATALVRSHLIRSAASLGIADRLGDRARSAEDLAAECGVNADMLRRVLRGLVGIGVFSRDADGRFRNNAVSRALRADAPSGVKHFAEYFAAPYHARAWAEFEHTLRTGKNAFGSVYGRSFWQYGAEHPDAGANFAAAMGALTRMEAPAIVAGFDFGRFGTVCDVAGGTGTLLASVLARNPSVRGILFDDAAVLARADEVLDAFGVRTRVEKSPGTFFERVPAGADAYVLKDILHDWDDAVCRKILDNVRRAAAPGASLLVVEFVVEELDSEPVFTFADLQMAVICDEGRQRSREDFARLFDATGFRLERVVALPGLASVVEAVAR